MPTQPGISPGRPPAGKEEQDVASPTGRPHRRRGPVQRGRSDSSGSTKTVWATTSPSRARIGCAVSRAGSRAPRASPAGGSRNAVQLRPVPSAPTPSQTGTTLTHGAPEEIALRASEELEERPIAGDHTAVGRHDRERPRMIGRRDQRRQPAQLPENGRRQPGTRSRGAGRRDARFLSVAAVASIHVAFLRRTGPGDRQAPLTTFGGRSTRLNARPDESVLHMDDSHGAERPAGMRGRTRASEGMPAGAGPLRAAAGRTAGRAGSRRT